jgi:hypothetical protein
VRPATRLGRVVQGLIGCLAAYTIAFQLALSGLLIVSHVTAAQTEICAEHAASPVAEASGQPVDQHPVCPCGPACAIFACMALVGALPSRPRMAFALAGSQAPPCPALQLGAPRRAALGPHSARAPPLG